MKLTAIFIGCGQDGVDHWTNWYKTRVIKLTEEQKALLMPPDHMGLSTVIFEYDDEDYNK